MKIEWEQIADKTYRLKTDLGWLILYKDDAHPWDGDTPVGVSITSCMVFVPFPHKSAS